MAAGGPARKRARTTRSHQLTISESFARDRKEGVYVCCPMYSYPLSSLHTPSTLPMQQNRRWRHWQKWLICLPLHSSTPPPLPTVPPQRVPCYFRTPHLPVQVSPAVYHAGRHCVVHQAQQENSHLHVSCSSVRIRVKPSNRAFSSRDHNSVY